MLCSTMCRLIFGFINVCLCFTLLNSCSHSVLGNSKKTKDWAHTAIFVYLEEPDFFLNMLTGKGRIKLDPLLCRRENLIMNGKVYFDDPMRSDSLKYPLFKKTYRLVIPDSLTRKYEYTGFDKDYEHDYAIIHQFSPLLPTTEPNIYLMEHYIWANICKGNDCVRLLNRDYLKFKIEGRKVMSLDGVLLRNQIDFIGFGAFSKKKMEEALPGEKIAKFGW